MSAGSSTFSATVASLVCYQIASDVVGSVGPKEREVRDPPGGGGLTRPLRQGLRGLFAPNAPWRVNLHLAHFEVCVGLQSPADDLPSSL